ncbi:MAG: hypothetical protein ABGZ24_29740, partial [Fuerstiella sp.]
GHTIAVQNSSYAIVSDGHFEQFNARRQDDSKSGNHSGNKPPRIDANDDESMLPPMLPPADKTLKTNKNAGFGTGAIGFTEEPTFPKQTAEMPLCVSICIRRVAMSG